MNMERAFRPKQAAEGAGASLEVEKTQLIGELKDDQARVKGFTKGLEYVTQAKLSDPSAIVALFDPKYDGQDYLRFKNQDVRTVTGTYLKKDDVEASGIPNIRPESRPLLIELANARASAESERLISVRAVSGLSKGLEFIIQSKLANPAEIEALFEPKYDGQDYLRFNRGDVRTATGSYLQREGVEATGIANIRLESRPLLLEIANARASADRESIRTKKVMTGFSKALEYITQAKLTNPAAIEAFFDPKYDPQDYLRFNREDVRTTNGTYVKREDVEKTGIDSLTGKSKELLRELATFKNVLPEEVRENLIRFVSATDPNARERMQQMMVRMGGMGLEDRLIEWTREFDIEQRRARFEAEFYQGLKAGESLAQLEARISGYENDDESDTQLGGRLREAALARRREQVIAESLALTAGRVKNYEAFFESLSVLARSPFEKDKEAARIVAEQGALQEIAEYEDRILKQVTNDVDPDLLRTEIESLPIRPSIGAADYVQSVARAREQVAPQVAEILRVRRLGYANKIRESFDKEKDVEKVLASIEEFPGETAEDLEIKSAIFELYKTYVGATRPDIYDQRFSGDMAGRIRGQLEAKFVQAELGKNREAFNYMRERFVSSIFPLIESLRANPAEGRDISKFLDPQGTNGGRVNPRRQFEQRLSALEAQRPLTDIERNYLESVELLSLFNPYLVAAACVDPGVTNAFLRHHFGTISQRTLDSLEDDMYVPAIQIGTGPNGLAAAGEVVRNAPELAASMLFIDQSAQPGGPFALPGGAAWELNSANRRGLGGPALSERPREDKELSTVRAYGSPLRWYPGERSEGADIRQGSINATVDYLPTPDDLSSSRYPTNEEEATILSLQAAMLFENVALNTRITKVRPNPNENEKGDKIVTLEVRGESGLRTIQVRTDAVLAASGLGEQAYGFTFEGSRAQRVRAETDGKEGFPKVSRTLEAFGALSNRAQENVSPGETIIIYGKGNSADTLIEFISSIFQGNNPRVRDVRKIYLIASGELSSRPRYAAIADIKPRNGKGNLVEFVNAKVSDIDFATDESDPMARKLFALDASGNPITDRNGNEILGDSVISAAGFRPQLDALFEDYQEERGDGSGYGLAKEKLVLPTNPGVPVAETLSADPNVVLLGTASNPYFNGNIDKLGQLPREAREALLRNGAENAVAIGFRAPDTQAAMNIWLNSREISVEAPMREPRKIVALAGDVEIGARFGVASIVRTEDIRIPNNIKDESTILSPLLSYSVGTAIEVSSSEQKNGFTGQVNFVLTLDQETNALTLEYQDGPPVPISQELVDTVMEACEEKDFQNYARSILGKKRRKPTLELALSFKAGKINPSETFVQD